MRENLLTRDGVYILHDFRLFFFFSNLFINGQAFIISKKKILYCARECKRKDIQIIINPQFYFTDMRKQLWNCFNIYESAVSITSPLKTITDPLKEIKWSKQT